MIRDDLKRHKANQKIANTIVKNTNDKGEWKAIRRLEPKDCKVGDVVLNFQNSICEIKEVKHNSNKHGDTRIVLNRLSNDERSISCSHGGVFKTTYKLKQ
jgi:hypothetical protein